jgi:hypothetical protein
MHKALVLEEALPKRLPGSAGWLMHLGLLAFGVADSLNAESFRMMQM